MSLDHRFFFTLSCPSLILFFRHQTKMETEPSLLVIEVDKERRRIGWRIFWRQEGELVRGFPGGNLLPKDNRLQGKLQGVTQLLQNCLNFIFFFQSQPERFCQFYDCRVAPKKVTEGEDKVLKFKARVMKCHWSPNRLELGGVSYIILELGV